MKRNLFLLLTAWSLNVMAQSNPPNIVLILVDDAGYADFGFQGSELMKTPHLDQLKDEGTFFSRAYVTNSVCAPSRAGLLTGRYQNRFGFEFNIVKYEPAPGRTPDDVGLDPNEKTLADYLKALGYSTAMIGKWHLGEEDHHHPNNRGFDYFYGLLSGSRPYFSTTDLPSNKKLMRNHQFDDLAEGYMTDVLTDDAIAWMTQQLEDQTPFFTFLSYTAVHGPYESKPEDLAEVTNCDGCSDKRKNLVAMTSNFDQNLGKLIDTLESRGVYDNTLLMVINDNGGPDPGSVTNNGVLRGGKSSQYEGGLRVPFVMKWADHVPANQTFEGQVISLDIAATAIKAAGGALPSDKPLDGVDLIPVINEDMGKAHDYLFWRKNWKWSIVSKGNLKLIINRNDPSTLLDNDTLLYDLDNDISESNNIFRNVEKTVIDGLIDHLSEWEETLVLPDWLGENDIENLCGSKNAELSGCELVERYYQGVDPQVVIYQREFENAELSGPTIEIRDNCETASGGAFVKLDRDSDNSIELSINEIPATGEYYLNMRYYSGDMTSISVNTNGSISTYQLPESEWCYEGSGSLFELPLILNRGMNRVMIHPVDNQPSPLLDNWNLIAGASVTLAFSEDQPIRVYPNPIDGYVQIKTSGRTLKHVEVIGMAGQRTRLGDSPSGFYDLNSLPAGIYIVEVTFEDGHQQRRKVLKK